MKANKYEGKSREWLLAEELSLSNDFAVLSLKIQTDDSVDLAVRHGKISHELTAVREQLGLLGPV